MAKIGILSDIHSNSDALAAVLGKCADLGVDEYISLGDIVGYGADPAACVAMMRELQPIAFVIGNHDFYATSDNPELSGFNERAQTAINWTREKLVREDLDFLRRPDSSIIPGFGTLCAVHATLDTPRNWGYIYDRNHAEAHFSYQLTQICFCGHTHQPVAFEKRPMSFDSTHGIVEIREWVESQFDRENDNNFDIEDELPIVCKRGHKYLFNVGSIGQPRNHDPRASFAVFDSSEYTVTRYRIPYDIGCAQRKILDAGLPDRLAYRLADGT